MTISNSLSVGLPPPSLRSQPFFFHLRRFLLGMPNSLEIILTSSPERIYVRLKEYPFNSLHLFLVGVFPVWPADLSIQVILALRLLLT